VNTDQNKISRWFVAMKLLRKRTDHLDFAITASVLGIAPALGRFTKWGLLISKNGGVVFRPNRTDRIVLVPLNSPGGSRASRDGEPQRFVKGHDYLH
jgi:hypothetical protein